MSSSAFYKHFKTVTMTTPLQYQKDLRLTEARRLLRAGQFTVSAAAFEVGYESPSQFSREYARKFGAAPSVDLRAAGIAVAP
jgi:AraC-like DNA-binding protein